MYYTVYKITNLENGKVYIGAHKTNDLDDGYMGSGKIIIRAIKKYGIEHFHKEYLEIFDNADDMFKMESNLVDNDFILREDTYNLKLGGEGSFDFINNNTELRVAKNKLAAQRTHEALERKYGDGWKSFIRERMESAVSSSDRSKWSRINGLKMTGFFKGQKHTQETKSTISKKAKERLKDKTKNSQFGTKWITDGIYNKKINSSDDVPDGWRYGRVMDVDKLNTKNLLQREKYESHTKKHQQKVDDIKKWHNNFIESDYKSVREFVRMSDYPNTSQQLSRLFKKYIPNYMN
jgi:hypothetical protein